MSTQDAGRSTSGRDFREWHQAFHRLTADQEAARAWRRTRYTFAYRLSQALVGAADPVGAIEGPAVYGVWLNWGLLYVGHTREAQRRLWDLAIGESHHLANTFPPEIWKRVVVIPWPALPAASSVPADVTVGEAGLAREYRLQRWLGPLVNAEVRTRDGKWRPRSLENSRSRGAQTADRVDELFEAVKAVWVEAARVEPPLDQFSETYRTVFPAKLLEPPHG